MSPSPTTRPTTHAPPGARPGLRGGAARFARPAFTLMELLVVVVIVSLLIGLAAVSFSGALSGGRRAATQQFLSNISLAIEQFKNDFGYYPPLLNPDEEDMETNDRLIVLDGLGSDPAENEQKLWEARFNSVYSLSAYLVGVGDIDGDGMEDAKDDGNQGPGFRSPGADQSWGGARNRDQHRATTIGRTYGPYMDVADSRNFHRIPDRDPAGGDGQNPPLNPDRGLYVFIDRWETPIRYYRLWPTKNPDVTPPAPWLERVPIELIDHKTLRATGADGVMDPAAERDLLNAPYALLSAGEDEEFANVAFSEDEIETDFRNSEQIRDLLNGATPTAARDRDLFLRSVENNVRLIP